MEFDKNSTLKLAKLARLSLNDKQLDSLEKDLTSIVSFIDQLKEINTDKIDPTSNSLNQDLILRDDIAENKLSNEVSFNLFSEVKPSPCLTPIE